MTHSPAAGRWSSAPRAGSRVKVVAAAVLAGVCVLTLGLVVSGRWWVGSAVRAPEASPAEVAAAVSDALAAHAPFRGVAFTVESERPRRFAVRGTVASEADLDDLEGYLRDLRPQRDYTVEVRVASAGPR